MYVHTTCCLWPRLASPSPTNRRRPPDNCAAIIAAAIAHRGTDSWSNQDPPFVEFHMMHITTPPKKNWCMLLVIMLDLLYRPEGSKTLSTGSISDVQATVFESTHYFISPASSYCCSIQIIQHQMGFWVMSLYTWGWASHFAPVCSWDLLAFSQLQCWGNRLWIHLSL
jgi:hypothetical protein